MNWYPQTLLSICRHFGADPETPWKRLPVRVREVILWGSGSEAIRIELEDGRVIEADHVVSNCDVQRTCRTLLATPVLSWRGKARVALEKREGGAPKKR